MAGSGLRRVWDTKNRRGSYSADFPAALAFRHLALAAADNAALAAALNRFLGLAAGPADAALTFAHLFARAWARAFSAVGVIVRRFLRALPGGRPRLGATSLPGAADGRPSI